MLVYVIVDKKGKPFKTGHNDYPSIYVYGYKQDAEVEAKAWRMNGKELSIKRMELIDIKRKGGKP